MVIVRVRDVVNELEKLANSTDNMKIILGTIEQYSEAEGDKELMRGKTIKQTYSNNDVLKKLTEIKRLLVELDINNLFVNMRVRFRPQCEFDDSITLYVEEAGTKSNVLQIIQDRIDAVITIELDKQTRKKNKENWLNKTYIA